MLRSLPFAALLLTAAMAQTPRPVAPVPGDPLELATGPIDLADTPEKHAAAMSLLDRAARSQDLHRTGGSAFSIRVSFESLGESRFTGHGTLEETWLKGSSWRWTTQLGDYSQLRIFANGHPYDENPGAVMPLRVHMVRSAVFWPVSQFPNPLLRTAPANWNGVAVTCILLSRQGWNPASEPGRRWEEIEYCIEPKSGRLQTLSIAPGVYSAYDYTDGPLFAGRAMPRNISIVEAGSTVLRIRVDSMEPAGQVDPSLLTPTAAMIAAGPGITSAGPFRFPQRAPGPKGISVVEPVIVNAILDPDGHVIDAEPLQVRDPQLAQAAVSFVRGFQFPATTGRRFQREAYINVKFIPQQ